MHRRALQPGDWVIIALIAAGHAADIPLVRRGHATVSTCSRRWLWFLVAFGIHSARPGCRLDLWRLGQRRWDRYLATVPR